jgi:hypothetical protein
MYAYINVRENREDGQEWKNPEIMDTQDAGRKQNKNFKNNTKK